VTCIYTKKLLCCGFILGTVYVQRVANLPSLRNTISSLTRFSPETHSEITLLCPFIFGRPTPFFLHLICNMFAVVNIKDFQHI